MAPDGTGDYPTIQAAVDSAAIGDTIELLEGVFRGEGNWDVSVSKSLTIRGLQEDPRLCVIDCSDDEPHRAFVIESMGIHPVFENITICNGVAHGGGAVAITPIWAHATFSYCMFVNNTATSGGAIASSSPIILKNCTFFGNAGEYGAHICAFDWGSSESHNCIFAFSASGSPFSPYDDIRGVTCCDVFGNAGGDYVDRIADKIGVDGNICLDPLFCDPSASDLSLEGNSPCAPYSAPNAECALIGALPVGCGVPAVQTGTWGAVKGLYR